MVKIKKKTIKEEPIDKVEEFMFFNYKKIIVAVAVLLLIFAAGFTIRQVTHANTQKTNIEIGVAEAMLSGSNVNETSLQAFKALAAKDSSAANYIFLKAGLVEASNGLTEAAQQDLARVKGGLRELADGKAFDIGVKGVDVKKYIASGNMKPLWYYRAVLSAEGEEKTKLLSEFAEKYPNNPLYELVARW